jgi:hypothetical protein
METSGDRRTNLRPQLNLSPLGHIQLAAATLAVFRPDTKPDLAADNTLSVAISPVV